jgi:pimeloyl-ACP methyl ester carboxylesterase
MPSRTGYARNGLPFARLSDSGPPLAIFTGSEIEHRPPSRTAQLGFTVGLKRLSQQYTLYLMSRKPDLPQGYTARDMSDDFAEMIRTEIGGPVHVMGMSSGGSSAMHFAVDHAGLVNRLVLAMTACRLNEHGKAVCRIWRDLALKGDWPALWERMGVDVAEGGTPEWLIRPMMRWFGGAILGRPKSGSDLAVVLESDVNLEVADRLPAIAAPTLVIGGARDPFYGADNIRQTAQRIPNAGLCLIEGGGHAVVKTHTRAFEDRLLEFLKGGA